MPTEHAVKNGESQMATKAPKTETKTRGESATKSARKSARREQLDAHVERNGAHAYAERVPIMADELADNGGSATAKELFKALSTGEDGLFATIRRINATYRYDQAQESPVFARDNGSITLAKRNRKSRQSERVSKRQTRESK